MYSVKDAGKIHTQSDHRVREWIIFKKKLKVPVPRYILTRTNITKTGVILKQYVNSFLDIYLSRSKRGMGDLR